jgi:tetratricopeptide (TPR) repeat protein
MGRAARRAALAADRRKAIEEGWQLYRAQRFEDARMVFARLAGKPGAPAGVFLGLGKVAFQKELYAEAAARAREALRRGEGLAAQMLLGDAQYRMQQYREAQKTYREALKLNPAHEPAQRALQLIERRLQ